MKRQPLRINVLLLILMGYTAILTTFVVLACGTLTASQAYETVQAPLMALIGGTLAIAKDLVPSNDQKPSGKDGSGE